MWWMTETAQEGLQEKEELTQHVDHRRSKWEVRMHEREEHERQGASTQVEDNVPPHLPPGDPQAVLLTFHRPEVQTSSAF